MNEFLRGVLFTVSMYVFGKSMYELGRIYEQEKNSEIPKRDV